VITLDSDLPQLSAAHRIDHRPGVLDRLAHGLRTGPPKGEELEDRYLLPARFVALQRRFIEGIARGSVNG